MNEPSNTDSNGEIEPKPEAICNDENEEPTRKRARVTGSSEGMFDKVFAEAMEKEFIKKKIEERIRVIHQATLGISDYTTDEVGKLEAKIQKIETENSELKHKIGPLEEQVEKLQKANLQNEIKNLKLKEYILKMREDRESHSKSIDLKISELEGKVLKQEKLLEEHENSTKQLIEEEIRVKMIDEDRKSCEHEDSIRKIIEEEVQLKMANQESAFEKMKMEWKQKIEENLKANCQQEEQLEKLEKAQNREKIDEGITKRAIKACQEKILNVEFDLKECQQSNKENMKTIHNTKKFVNNEWKEKVVSIEKAFTDESAKLKIKYEQLEQSQKDENQTLKQRFSDLENCYDAFTKFIIEHVKNQTDPETPDSQVEVSNDVIIQSDDCELLTTADVEDRDRCFFFKRRNHKSIECRRTAKHSKRMRLVRKRKRCEKCLEIAENHSCTRANVVCSNCQWDTRVARRDKDFHHPFVCPLNDQTPAGNAKREKENERRRRYGLPPRFAI